MNRTGNNKTEGERARESGEWKGGKEERKERKGKERKERKERRRGGEERRGGGEEVRRGGGEEERRRKEEGRKLRKEAHDNDNDTPREGEPTSVSGLPLQA